VIAQCQIFLEAQVKIVPLGDRVLIRPVEKEKVTSGGIVLPGSAQEKQQICEVLAVGPGGYDDDGKKIVMEVAVGDKVISSKYSGTEVKVDGEEYTILRQSDILAKVEG
jgi:chaperonin GroES